MGAQQQKPTSVGSAYINVRKGTSNEIQEEVNNAIEFLKDQKAYISISVRKNNGDGYIKMTGFFNEYKRAPKDPDIMIRMSEVAQAPRKENRSTPSYQKKATPARVASPRRGNVPTKENAEGFDSDEVPFG